jgi:hypothetical protein
VCAYSNGKVTGNKSPPEVALAAALVRLELLKLRIIRLAKSYEEGLELYQDVWLLLLKRGERLDEFVRDLSRIMKIARKMHCRQQSRLRMEFMHLKAYRQRLLNATPIRNGLDVFESSDAAEALRGCWQALGEPGQRVIHAMLTVQGPIRDQAYAMGMNTASFLQRKRYIERVIAKAIAAHFPSIVSEMRNFDR